MKVIKLIRWDDVRVGVKEYEHLTYDWWYTRLHKLASEKKWCALFVALTMLNEVGALPRMGAYSLQRGIEIPGLASTTLSVRKSAKVFKLGKK